MSGDEGQRRAYSFLLQHAKSQERFTVEEFRRAVGWSEATAKTYLGKQLKSVVQKAQGAHRVKKEFIYLEEAVFVKRTSQKESILPSYVRTSYDSVLVYEFLMPLTREDLLRQSLDLLFFEDTLLESLRSIGLDSFSTVVPRRIGENDDAYGTRIAVKVSDYVGGYSITHANGRFRADELLTQQRALRKRYIIDETTAVVRFIIPLKTTKQPHSQRFSPNVTPFACDKNALDDEVVLVRTLFFTIFAEVVVHSVQGEDQIWLLEDFNGHKRLYTWCIES